MEIKELYRKITEIENRAARRDLTDAEFEEISLLQDQISDIECPGYEIKETYETANRANDTLAFYVMSLADGIPVDRFAVKRQGDKYLVLGYWRDYQTAKDWARQALSKWF